MLVSALDAVRRGDTNGNHLIELQQARGVRADSRTQDGGRGFLSRQARSRQRASARAGRTSSWRDACP